jgi:hypothetical protein
MCGVSVVWCGVSVVCVCERERGKQWMALGCFWRSPGKRQGGWGRMAADNNNTLTHSHERNQLVNEYGRRRKKLGPKNGTGASNNGSNNE